MQSDCGVPGSPAQAGVPGLFPSNHPFQEMKQPTIHCASIWPPFPPSKSGLEHNTRQRLGPRAEILLGSLPSATPAQMTLTVLLPSLDNPTTQLSHPPSLGLRGIYHEFLPWQPLTSTDPSRDLSSPLASPSAIHILTQVPKTLRLDGATREEGKFLPGNQGTGLPGTQGQ